MTIREFEHRKDDPPVCPEQIDSLSVRQLRNGRETRQEFLAAALCQMACAVGEDGPHCQKMMRDVRAQEPVPTFLEKRGS